MNQWLGMNTAPTDGTAILLLIEDGEHPFDEEGANVTIGSYGVEGGPQVDPTWHFAGWSWEHDCYCRGSGVPLGWMPLPGVDMTQVWVCGRVTHICTQPREWELQGVFSTEEAAVSACRDHTYFVGPVKLNESLPHETLPEWPGAHYPIDWTAK